MYQNRHRHVLMAAIGAVLSAGAAAVAQAVEHVAVDIGIKATHAFTEQVCHFDTVAQLEAFLDGVADRHHWTRSDKPEIPAAPLELEPIDTTGADQLATAIATADAASTVHVDLDLNQLRAGTAPADAITVTTSEPAAPIASSDTTTTADTPAA